MSYCEFIHSYLYSCTNRPQSPDKQASPDNGKPFSSPPIKTGTTARFWCDATVQSCLSCDFRSRKSRLAVFQSFANCLLFNWENSIHVSQGKGVDLADVAYFFSYVLFVWSKNKGPNHTRFLLCFSDLDCSLIASVPTLDSSCVRPSSGTVSENGRSLSVRHSYCCSSLTSPIIFSLFMQE